MDKLENVKPLFALLLRSPNRGDGWRSISDMLAPMVTEQSLKAPGLFEMDCDEDGFRIRLTERGKVVADYL